MMKNRLSEARGGHHCPHKDGKKSHAVKDSCIKKKHGGYCPTCGRFVCFFNGCMNHRFKGADLLMSWPPPIIEEEPEDEEEVEKVEVKKNDKTEKKGGKRSKRN